MTTTVHTLARSAPNRDLVSEPLDDRVAQLHENAIDIEIAITDEDDFDRLLELFRLRHDTREALARVEPREVSR